MTDSREKLAWGLLCQRLGRDPATSEEDETCSLRSAWKAMLAFADRIPLEPTVSSLYGYEAGLREAERQVEAMRERCARYIEGDGGVIPGATVFVSVLSGDNMPCMSGDGRDRLRAHRRRQFDDATAVLASAIRSMPLSEVKS